MTGMPPEFAEVPCERCRVLTLDCFMERAEDGELLCPGCAADEEANRRELFADEPEDDEDQPHCRGGCSACLGLSDRSAPHGC